MEYAYIVYYCLDDDGKNIAHSFIVKQYLKELIPEEHECPNHDPDGKHRVGKFRSVAQVK